MTDKMQKEIKATEEERLAGLDEVEKFKNNFAKKMTKSREEMLAKLNHVPTKKEIRKYKRTLFFNKIKRALGL
jgi:hypothetical protein